MQPTSHAGQDEVRDADVPVSLHATGCLALLVIVFALAGLVALTIGLGVVLASMARLAIDTAFWLKSGLGY